MSRRGCLQWKSEFQKILHPLRGCSFGRELDNFTKPVENVAPRGSAAAQGVWAAAEQLEVGAS